MIARQLRSGPSASLSGRVPPHNPFVEIEPVHRHIVIGYFLFWRFLPDAVTLFNSHSASSTVLGLTLAAQFAWNFLLLLPFLVARFGGIPMGWLNPLALGALLTIVRDLIKDPLHLFAPVLVWFEEPGRLQHRLLDTWSVEATQWVSFKILAWGVVGTLAYYAAFAAFNKRTKPAGRTARPQIPSVYFVAVWAALMIAFLALVMGSGGVMTHLASLVQGRFNVREDVGPLLVLVQFGPFVLVAWYLTRPEVIRTSYYWVILAVTLGAQFVANGSRSSVIIPVVVLVSGWMLQNRRVPAVRGLLLAAAALLLLSVLGSIRNSPLETGGTISFDAVTKFDVTSVVLDSQEQMARRQWQSGGVAVAALVPREHDYLYGRTYITAVSFFVPRTIWADKPRGPGAWTHAVLFQKRKSPASFRGASFPPSAAGEAYWNFGWLGIIAIFGLFGAFHKWLAQSFLEAPEDVWKASFLFVGIIIFGAPDTDSFIGFAQISILLFLTLKVGSFLQSRPGARATLPA